MAKASKRHDFKKQVILLLKSRAGDICSNPTCRVHTLGSGFLAGKSVSIGVAAHIYAASPGGPRYSDGMSEELRRSYENGIWLCQTCSRLIDVDEHRFPAEVLLAWKAEAEERSLRSVGQRSITQQEKEKAVRVAYGQGVLEYSSGSVEVGSVAKVLEGYEQGLSELDERFEVIVESATATGVSHRISPKNGHSPTVSLSVCDVGGSWSGLRRLEDFGEAVEIDGRAVEFKGSELFEHLSRNIRKGGSLTIAGIGKKIETYVLLRSEDAGDYELASFESIMHSGAKGVSISGSALGGIIKVRVVSELAVGTNLDVNYSVEPWLGRRLDKLSYFPKLSRAKEFLKRNADARLVVEFYYKGSPIVFDSPDIEKQAEFLDQLFYILTLLESCRILAARFSDSLILKDFSASDFESDQITKYSSLIGGVVNAVPAGRKICEGILFSGIERTLDDWGDSGKGWVRFKENPSDSAINVLGNNVVPPPVLGTLHRFEIALFCKLKSKGSGEISYVVSAVDGSTIEWSLDSERPWVLMPG
ncbi:hypothetical protein [Stutzerimonas kunmingensis]|uniref:hypothetical protein n=1 Tax=Stutzerimonas kunmingensis TaxID=1211807 RepID=UPI0028A7B826|nr:hypothetical protein [Stutzerimonas kunmingensis]